MKFWISKSVSHKNNPVIFDSNQARNGGIIFSENNQLYRVFQRQGFDMYGSSLGISKIKTLNENEYKEEILTTIEPKFFKNMEYLDFEKPIEALVEKLKWICFYY